MCVSIHAYIHTYLRVFGLAFFYNPTIYSMIRHSVIVKKDNIITAHCITEFLYQTGLNFYA